MKCQFRVIFLIYENRTVHWINLQRVFGRIGGQADIWQVRFHSWVQLHLRGVVVPFPVRNMPDLFAFNMTLNSIQEDSINIRYSS